MTVSDAETAHHEAAHAIADCVLFPNRQRGMVTIVPNDDAGTKGSSTSEQFDRFDIMKGASVDDIERECIALYAGLAAGLRIDPDKASYHGEESDFDKAEALLSAAAECGIAVRNADDLYAAAVEFVDKHWLSIAFIASALLEWRRIDDSVVSALLEFHRGEGSREELIRFLACCGRLKGEPNQAGSISVSVPSFLR